MKFLFLIVITVVIIQRLTELMISRRNEVWLRQRGAYEVGQAHYKYLVILHSMFFVVLIAEVFFRNLDSPVWWWIPLSIVLFAQCLRIWSISALGRRWTTRILVLPGAGIVTSGAYRFMRHPSYTAVVLELLALPLMFNAIYTAVIFSVLNIIIMSIRIPIETRALKNATTGELETTSASTRE